MHFCTKVLYFGIPVLFMIFLIFFSADSHPFERYHRRRYRCPHQYSHSSCAPDPRLNHLVIVNAFSTRRLVLQEHPVRRLLEWQQIGFVNIRIDFSLAVGNTTSNRIFDSDYDVNSMR